MSSPDTLAEKNGQVIWKGSWNKPLSDGFLGVFLDNARDLIPIPPPTEEALLERWNPVVKDAHAVCLTPFATRSWDQTQSTSSASKVA